MKMTSEASYRFAFLILFILLASTRIIFMVRVRLSGNRILPGRQAVEREGGRGPLIIRVVAFFGLLAFLVLYILGAGRINFFNFNLPDWLHWTGFGIGIVTVAFWTWVQIVLDTQWSAQLQLTDDHHLITTGPYARIRHPLYSGVVGWCIALTLLTANWIFVLICVFAVAGLLWRIPKEEQMMIEAFGDEYRVYMQHTGRFFPKK